MLQRIQTVFMFLASIFAIGATYFNLDNCGLGYLIGSSILSLIIFVNIFLFKNRKLQISINRMASIGLIILLGLSFYKSGILSGENSFSEKDIKLTFPVISIVFLLIANKYIKRDETLVKSVDRIR